MSARFRRIADNIKVPAPNPGECMKKALMYLGANQPSDLEFAKSRENFMVAVRLRGPINDKMFVVGTYHMPCSNQRPEVMKIHTREVVEDIRRFAGTSPYILAGDFNFQPHEEVYTLVTKKMKSAYKVANRREPEFTNYTQNKFHDKPFSACLDYIFYNSNGKSLQLSTVNKTYKKPRIGVLPNEDIPSDHIPLGACFELN